MPIQMDDGRRILVGQPLHEGAMAKLHEVIHEGERMLLKTAMEGTTHDKLNVEVLDTEAKALSQCAHPGIVPMLGHAGEKGVMLKMLDGPDLRMLVREPMPFVRAIRITTDILDALCHLHRRGMVHGDLKPENVVMHRDHPVLVDLANAEPPQGGQRMGTPPYCPPEQLDKGAVASPADDIYAAARILEFLCLGTMPKQIVDADWLDSLPSWVAAWVVDAVHPDGRRRFKDAASALRRLPPTRLGTGGGGWRIEGGEGDGLRLPIRIGRASDNHICIDDPQISRYHATLAVSNSGNPYLLDHSGSPAHRPEMGLLGHSRLFAWDSIVIGGHAVGVLRSG